MVRQAPNPTNQNQFYPFGERPMPPTKNGKPVNPAVVPLHDVSPLPDGVKMDRRFSISSKRRGITLRAPSVIPDK